MSTSRPMLRYVLGNCGAIVIGLSVTYVALLQRGSVSKFFIWTGDFIQYFGVSRMILHGHGGAIYNLHRLSHVENIIVYPLSVGDSVMPYLYPPYFAMLVAPLASIPYAAAYLLWFLGNCVLLFVSLFVLERYAGLSLKASMWVRLVTVASMPVIETFLLGQVSIIILALLVFSFFSLRSHHDYLAGAALALALVKPPYVVPFLVVLLVRKNWSYLRAFSVTAVALLLLPLPVLGLSIQQVYARLLIAASQWQGQRTMTYQGVKVAPTTYDPHANLGLSGFAELLLPSPLSRLVVVVLVLAVLSLLAYSAHRCEAIDLPFALATLAALLVNPHVLIHDLAILILPVWVAFRYQKIMAIPHLLPVLTFVYAAATVGQAGARFIHLQVPTIAILALGGWLYMVMLRSIATDGRRSPAKAVPISEPPPLVVTSLTLQKDAK